jgi:hypothetical protein
MKLSDITKKQPINNFQLIDDITTSNVEKPAAKIGMFDFFKVFFSTKHSDWSTISNDEKLGHSFMLLQYLSIKEPEIAAMSQNMLTPVVIDALHFLFSKNYGGKSPGWMFTKLSRKQEKAIDLKKYSKEILTRIKSRYRLDSKDFDFLLTYETSLLEELLIQEQSSIDMKKQK